VSSAGSRGFKGSRKSTPFAGQLAAEDAGRKAARRAIALGYRNVFVLAGGIEAWAAAGHPVYAGVFVPSKAFGELVEIERSTPRIGPLELRDRQAAGDNLVVCLANSNCPGGGGAHHHAFNNGLAPYCFRGIYVLAHRWGG